MDTGHPFFHEWTSNQRSGRATTTTRLQISTRVFCITSKNPNYSKQYITKKNNKIIKNIISKLFLCVFDVLFAIFLDFGWNTKNTKITMILFFINGPQNRDLDAPLPPPGFKGRSASFSFHPKSKIYPTIHKTKKKQNN